MDARSSNSSPNTGRQPDSLPTSPTALPEYLRRASGDFAQVILWALDYETLYYDNLRVLVDRFLIQVLLFPMFLTSRAVPLLTA